MASPTRSFLVALMVGLVAFGATRAVDSELSLSAQSWARRVARGDFVLDVRSDSGLDGARCDQLATVRGVIAAGGVASPRRADLAAISGSDIQSVEVTAGLVGLAWPETRRRPPSSDIVVGRDLARRLGDPGASSVLLELAPGEPRSVLAMPSSDRLATLDDQMLVPQSDLRVSVCYVEFTPGADSDVRSVLDSWFPARAHVVVGRPAGPGTSVSVPRIGAGWADSTSWTAMLASMAVLTQFWYGSRSELTLYLALGVRRPMLLGLLAAEAAIIGFAPAAVGATFALAVSTHTRWGTTALLVLTRPYLAVLAGCVLSAWPILWVTRRGALHRLMRGD